MEIDRKRLRSDIEANAEFGALDTQEGHGRTVLTGSRADRLARERFLDRLEDAGLDYRIDAVGNIVGRWVPAGADGDAPPIALGSHLDSVPEGGIFDGPLGVYGALEAVRALKRGDATLARPLEVVCFTEEEGGRFGIGTLGSLVATGGMATEEAYALTDDEGETLESRLEDIGFRGEARLDPAEWDAWLELHIEQDTRLETAGVPVGVVDAIAGITNCEATITGETDHAGATTMDERSDALAAAAAFVDDVERIARETAREQPTAVATVGRFEVEPNVRNIVPGRVQMQMDVRDVAGETIDEMVTQCESALDRIGADRGVDTSFRRYRDDPPTAMSDRCLSALGRASERCDLGRHRLHSAAIHDTANVAAHTDAAMIFAPSRDGISHSPREWTDWADCAKAVRVLAGAVLELDR